ncbi:MAG: hypothetical protein GYB53_07480 [Rhodobacteraceae bacterium]|nr:hypothetical protein [Paracoccaceae bacterium]MBR9823591.1 hypothetical protein [Paracoccaceae bacterium]
MTEGAVPGSPGAARPDPSSLLTLIIFVAFALHELGLGGAPVELAGIVSLGLYLLLHLRRLGPLIWSLLALIAGLLVALALRDALDVALIWAAIDSASFLVFFLLAVGLLNLVAAQTRLVRRCGELLIRQAPGRRYLMLTAGAHAMGLFLSIGSVGLLGTMVYRPTPDNGDAETLRIAGIRARRMATAILRGFSCIPMWSPTSVTIAILLTSFHEVSWFAYMPLGLGGAVVFIAVGWLADRMSYKRPALPSGEARKQADADLAELGVCALRILSVVACITVGGWAISTALDLRFFVGILLGMVPIGFSWLWLELRATRPAPRLPAMGRILRDGLRQRAANQHGEVAIFACAGMIGVLLPPLLDTAALSTWLSDNGISSFAVLAGACAGVVAIAMLGVGPVTTVAVFARILPELHTLEISPHLSVFALSLGWSIAITIAPASTTLRILANAVKLPLLKLGLGWSWREMLVVYGLFLLSLLVLM